MTYPVDEPNAARMWDWFAGGSHNTPVDRELAARITTVFPPHPLTVTGWGFQHRVVTELLDRGVRQFLDLGCGLPATGGVHEIAAACGADARTVYVDADPVVVHATAISLADTTRTAAVCADIRDPATLLEHPELRAVLDVGLPIGVLAFGVLDTITDADRPGNCVTALAAAFAPGSYLAISHLTTETAPDDLKAQLDAAIALFTEAGTTMVPRDTATVSAWLHDLEVLAPDVGLAAQWRPEHPVRPEPYQRLLLGAVARTSARTGHPEPNPAPRTAPRPELPHSPRPGER
jgi:hypothetical protein